MKVHCSLLLFSLCIMLPFSCSKIELDDGEEKETPVIPANPPQGGQEESSGAGKGDGSEDMSAYTVGQLASLPTGQDVSVVGYIVGYASGKSFHMGLPEAGGVSSNIVIADTPSPSEGASLAACQLVSGSKPREALNLVDHPDRLKCRVLLVGRVMKYFGYMGLKPLRSFTLLSDGGSDDNPPSAGGEDTPPAGDGGDKPSQGEGEPTTPPATGDHDKPSGGGQTDKPSGSEEGKPSGGGQDKPSGGGSTDKPSKDPDIGEGEY